MRARILRQAELNPVEVILLALGVAKQPAQVTGLPGLLCSAHRGMQVRRPAEQLSFAGLVLLIE